MENYCIYRHLKPDGTVFYIGMGSNIKRPYSKRNRNNYWKNIINKYGYEVQILSQNLSKKEVCDLEILLIEYYGRIDLGLGTLVNMTKGGDGVLDISEETKKKKRQSQIGKGGMKGKDNPMYGKTGELNPNYGSKRTKEQRLNMRKSQIGKHKGELNHMWGLKGKNSPNYGKKRTEEQKQKLRDLYTGIPLSKETKEKLRGERIHMQRGEHPKSKLTLCTETGIFYDCLKDAAEAYNIKYSALLRYLNPNYKNKSKTSLIKI